MEPCRGRVWRNHGIGRTLWVVQKYRLLQQRAACGIVGNPSIGGRRVVGIGNSFARGSGSAPVTIVEWGDFQCPFCAKAEPVLHELQAQYGSKIRLVWKNKPLSFHKAAADAARAALAAGHAGKFWEMHDLLLAHQGELDRGFDYSNAASRLGLDRAEFETARTSEFTQSEIRRDLSDAAQLGVQSTPTFLINGRPLVGVASFDEFKKLIDEELQQPAAPQR